MSEFLSKEHTLEDNQNAISLPSFPWALNAGSGSAQLLSLFPDVCLMERE